MKPAVFLDRDGTIIEDVGYLADEGQITFIPGAVEAIVRLKKTGLKVVIVSNQSGVARGFFSYQRACEIDSALLKMLEQRGAQVDASYFCPHLEGGSINEFNRDCDCRKPKTGMAELAAKELNLDLHASWVVGDKVSDLELARNIGAVPLLVRTGEGRATEAGFAEVASTFDSISEAADYIVNRLSMGAQNA